MRSIKFRVWSPKREEFVDPKEESLYLRLEGTLVWCASAGGIGGDSWLSDEDVSKEYELSQFTGFYDSKGVEIYENDIVTAPPPHHWEEPHLIKWPEDYWDLYEFRLVRSEGNQAEIEVIGNRWMNPELLEGE